MSLNVALYNAIGFLGTGLLVLAYFANQQRWLASTDWRYPALNLAGSLLILVSLTRSWNFPSVMIEVFWSAISLYGLFKNTRSSG